MYPWRAGGVAMWRHKLAVAGMKWHEMTERVVPVFRPRVPGPFPGGLSHLRKNRNSFSFGGKLILETVVYIESPSGLDKE